MQGACASGCPYGLVSDPFPGQCSRYIDVDGNGFCDLSQTVATTTTNQATNGDNSTQDTSSHGAHNGNIDTSTDPANATIAQDPETGGIDSTQPFDAHNYHILPISLLIIGGYFFTYYLFKKGILKPKKHMYIWNLFLVGGYFGTGVTGALLTLMVNLGVSTIYNPGITYWHAELSILMIMGTLVHLHLYRRPLKNMFRVLFGINFSSKKRENKKTVGYAK